MHTAKVAQLYHNARGIVKKTGGQLMRHKRLAGGLMLAAFAAAGGATWRLAKHSPTVQASQPPAITHSTDHPDESKTNADNYAWQGGDNDPKRIRISKINADAYIQRAGIDQHNKVAVPNNVHLASWFVESVRPGDKGLAVIDAHVSGRTESGLFKDLSKLTKDDTFEIEKGNGDTLHYRVLKMVSVPEADSVGVLFSQDPKVASQVNLITCGGAFDSKTDQYLERVIVSAALVN